MNKGAIVTPDEWLKKISSGYHWRQIRNSRAT